MQVATDLWYIQLMSRTAPITDIPQHLTGCDSWHAEYVREDGKVLIWSGSSGSRQFSRGYAACLSTQFSLQGRNLEVRHVGPDGYTYEVMP